MLLQTTPTQAAQPYTGSCPGASVEYQCLGPLASNNKPGLVKMTLISTTGQRQVGVGRAGSPRQRSPEPGRCGQGVQRRGKVGAGKVMCSKRRLSCTRNSVHGVCLDLVDMGCPRQGRGIHQRDTLLWLICVMVGFTYICVTCAWHGENVTNRTRRKGSARAHERSWGAGLKPWKALRG